MSKESIQSEIRNKEYQISSNNNDISSLSDRYDDLVTLKEKLGSSKDNLYSAIDHEKERAGKIKCSYTNSRFIGLYSDAITSTLSSGEASKAKSSISTSIEVVEEKMKSIMDQIETLQLENRSLTSAVRRLEEELRELEMEDLYGV